MSTADEIHAREESIRNLVQQLPDAKRLQFFSQAEKQLKDPDTYAVLNYLFIAGLHHFYLGRWGRGLINLAVFCSGLILLFAGYAMIGVFIMLGISLFELYALFNSQNIVAEYNNNVMEHIYRDLKTSGSG